MSEQQAAEQISGFQVSAFGTFGNVPKEQDLEWFFSTGQSLFEASTFGALLERQSQFGQKYEMCTTCNGGGFDADDNSCPRCRGMGGTPEPNSEPKLQDGLLLGTSRCLACSRPPRRPWRCRACLGDGRVNGATCDACNGKRVPLKANGQPRARPSQRPRAACWCCKGALMLDRSPVGLKSEQHSEPSYTPDDVALQRFAQVSRYLRQCTSDTVETLAAFFGLSGYRWGNTKWGRLFAVVPLTAAGEKLMARLPNPQELGEHQLLENHVADLEKLQERDHKQQAQARLETVTQQAAARFKLAVAEWRSVVRPAPPPALDGEMVAAA
jgi:hypothetical protein